MKKIVVFSILFSALALAGVVYAHGTNRNIMRTPMKLTLNIPIRAAVISVRGGTVGIFSPIGSDVLCKGDNLPVYRPPRGMSADKSYDLRKMQLVGEVKVERLTEGAYAVGRVVAGKVERGDIAAKPGESCLKG